MLFETMFSEFMISFITRNLFHRFQNIRNVKATDKEKSTVGNSTSGTAGSMWNNRYFGGIIRKLDDHKKNIIREHGFRILLEYDGCLVPRVFVQWLADQVDVNCGDIVVGGKIIPFFSRISSPFLRNSNRWRRHQSTACWVCKVQISEKKQWDF